MTNQITDTKLLENQILGNQIAGTPGNVHIRFRGCFYPLNTNANRWSEFKKFKEGSWLFFPIVNTSFGSMYLYIVHTS